MIKFALFFRTAGRLVTQGQTETALRKMLSIFARFPNLCK